MKNYEISYIPGCMWINTSVRGIYVLRVVVSLVI